MNVFQKIILKYPLSKMYIPWGWMVLKNNLINKDASLLIECRDSDKFEIINYFFDVGVFHAVNELTLGEVPIKSVVTIDYIYNDEKVAGSNSDYVIEMCLYKNKNKIPFYAYEIRKEGVDDMVDELNFILSFISNFVYDTGRIHDVDNYMIEVRDYQEKIISSNL